VIWEVWEVFVAVTKVHLASAGGIRRDIGVRGDDRGGSCVGSFGGFGAGKEEVESEKGERKSAIGKPQVFAALGGRSWGG